MRVGQRRQPHPQDGEGDWQVRAILQGPPRLLGLTFHDANGTRTGILHYRYDAFDQRIVRLADLDGVAGIEDKEYYIYDAAPGKGGLSDIVLRYDENRDVINRYLHGPGIDQIFSDENALNEILWSLADRQGKKAG